MQRILRGGGIILFMLTFAGCTSNVPQFEPGVTPTDVMNEIKCEIAIAKDDKTWADFSRLTSQAYVVQVNLTLQIDDQEGLAPSLTYMAPLDPKGLISFAFGGGALLQGQQQRIYSEIVYLNVQKLTKPTDAKLPCNQGGLQTALAGSITGDLGIGEIIRQGLGDIDQNDNVSFFSGSSKSSFGSTVKFVVTKNVNALGPTWSLKRFKGPGGLLSAQRVDTQSVILSFAPQTAPVAGAELHAFETTNIARPEFQRAVNSAAQNNSFMLWQSLLNSLNQTLP